MPRRELKEGWRVFCNTKTQGIIGCRAAMNSGGIERWDVFAFFCEKGPHPCGCIVSSAPSTAMLLQLVNVSRGPPPPHGEKTGHNPLSIRDAAADLRLTRSDLFCRLERKLC